MKANLAEVLSAITPGAAACFNTLDIDMALAVLDSADQLALPVVVGIATRHYQAMRAPLLVPSYLRAIEACSQPVALHLDHAGPHELDMIRQALDLGFTSIMIDGSRLPFSQNVDVTAQVVEMAHAYGASVEGEIGGIAGEEGVADTHADEPEQVPYTSTDEAKRFVEQTGVDALAIAVGTAHGIYTSEPHISFDTIRNIAAVVHVPLVLHGATGVSDAAIRESVSAGIRKINYFSGLLKNAMDHVRTNAASSHNDLLKFKQEMAGRWQEEMCGQMKLFSQC